MLSEAYDTVIIGGGPVGMALALALHDSGISTLLLEARGLPEKDEDPRPLALSHGSRLILQRLGVWPELSNATPITTIHISNQGSLGRTVLTSEDAGVPALGYVVNYHDLFKAMHQLLQVTKVDYLSGAQVTKFETNTEQGQVEFQYGKKDRKVAAKLLVLADGGRLTGQIENINYQVHEYQQWAIVANIKAEMPQSGIAYERFTPDGPVALLPTGDDFSLVWTVSPLMAQEILAQDDEVFLSRLHQHFGDRLGKFIKAGKRSGFPLLLKYATSNTSQRIALVGNAAQTLHPVAGQGFNLGLRDAWELASVILTTDVTTEIGTPAMLSRFHQKRQVDSNSGRIFTDSLVKLFSNDNILLKNICGIGLSALDTLPPLKRFVARRMIFGARG
ncbi:MAG: FAD-dependent monooxygenase [Nitrosomonas sp.]|nr:FAD-dependent monooxygenase [Nitrosomonas sp.]MDP1950991.1 FAD-dependent monooxygenase [Nitrosomonas sp.]